MILQLLSTSSPLLRSSWSRRKWPSHYAVNLDYYTAMAGLPPKPKPADEIRIIQTLPRVTSALSLIGSLLVIYMLIVSSKSCLSHARNRFVFAISVLDIPFSLMFALGPILMPRGVHEDSIGNDVTCSMQGCSFQTGYGEPIYNSFFMIYFAMQNMAGTRSNPGSGSSPSGNCPAFHRDDSPTHLHLVMAIMIVMTVIKMLLIMNQIYKGHDTSSRDCTPK